MKDKKVQGCLPAWHRFNLLLGHSFSHKIPLLNQAFNLDYYWIGSLFGSQEQYTAEYKSECDEGFNLFGLTLVLEAGALAVFSVWEFGRC